MRLIFRPTVPAEQTKSVARKRWLVLGIGIAAQAAFSLAFQGLPAAGNQLRFAYGLSLSQLGFALAAIYLGIVVSEIVWGILTDYVGERIILAVGLIGTALVLLLLSITSSWIAKSPHADLFLFLGFLIMGVLGGSVNGSSGRAVMGWFRRGQRGLAMSLRQTAVPFGGAIGAALFPILAGNGFSLAFAFIAACCLLTALASILWLTTPPLEAGAAPLSQTKQVSESHTNMRSNGQLLKREARSHSRSLRPVRLVPLNADRYQNKKVTGGPLRNITVWRIAIASGLLTIPQFAVLTFVPVFLHDERHVNLLVVSLTIVTIQLIGALLRVITGRWTDRIGQRRSMILTLSWLATGALFLAALFAEGPIVIAVVSLVLSGIFASSWHGITYTEIAEVAGAARSGTALGLENTTVFLGAFVTPLAGPAILHATSWPLLWGGVAVVTALSLPLLPRSKHTITLSTPKENVSKGGKKMLV